MKMELLLVSWYFCCRHKYFQLFWHFKLWFFNSKFLKHFITYCIPRLHIYLVFKIYPFTLVCWKCIFTKCLKVSIIIQCITFKRMFILNLILIYFDINVYLPYMFYHYTPRTEASVRLKIHILKCQAKL